MTIYTVLVPGQTEAAADPMAPVFVKEGFAWPALFFAPLWLIFRRLWLVLLAYIVAGIAIRAIGGVLGDAFGGAGMILLHFLLGLEGNEFRRWKLARRGFRLAAVVEGRGIEEAEIRYFAGIRPVDEATPDRATPPAAGPVPPPAPSSPPPLGPIRPSAEAGEVVGLFPAPGART